MRVTMKIKKNGKDIFSDAKEFDTGWECNGWCTRRITDSFWDDINNVRERRTNETVRFDDRLDVIEQHQVSEYITENGVNYTVTIDLLEES